MANGSPLLWGDGDGNTREVRGRSGVTRDRYGVIKFPKSLREPCNNKRSKPFDNSYDVYSHFVSRPWLRIMPGVDFRQIFGTDWEAPTRKLARHYGKHFGCRMMRADLPVPNSLRELLDGATDIPDAHMALITTDTVHKLYKGGLSISPDFVEADNCFEDEIAVCEGRTRYPGWFASLVQWANRPGDYRDPRAGVTGRSEVEPGE
jgi:hypothetical protein